jgi:uncharacterized protein
MPESPRPTALVTGASSGIGAEFAHQLAARGYDLALAARRTSRLEELARDLPTTAHVLECDLAADAESLPARVADLGLEVDLLVNNAGFGSYGRFWEIELGRDTEMVRVNCEAIVILTRAFLPRMVARGRGGVIVVASTSGMQPLPYTATYAATKAFALHFAEALHEELRGTGVRSLAINPGPVPTEWGKVAGIDTTKVVPGEISAEQAVREALAAYDAGKRSIIPGRMIRTLMRTKQIAPRGIELRVAERLYRSRGGA